MGDVPLLLNLVSITLFWANFPNWTLNQITKLVETASVGRSSGIWWKTLELYWDPFLALQFYTIYDIEWWQAYYWNICFGFQNNPSQQTPSNGKDAKLFSQLISRPSSAPSPRQEETLSTCKSQHCKQCKSLFNAGPPFPVKFQPSSKGYLQSEQSAQPFLDWSKIMLVPQTNSRHHNLHRSGNVEGSGRAVCPSSLSKIELQMDLDIFGCQIYLIVPI